MKFQKTALSGVYVIDIESLRDDRGFFARSWCRKEFATHDLNTTLVQCNISFTEKQGTLHGMHYQRPPYEEVRLIRCTSGQIFDVVIDLRPESRTYMKHISARLSADNRRMLYIPPRCANGFLTLAGNTEVSYQASQVYHPQSAVGVRWNDPTFGIVWPQEIGNISERDSQYPDYKKQNGRKKS